MGVGRGKTEVGRRKLEDGSPKSEVGRLVGDNLGGLFVFS